MSRRHPERAVERQVKRARSEGGRLAERQTERHQPRAQPEECLGAVPAAPPDAAHSEAERQEPEVAGHLAGRALAEVGHLGIDRGPEPAEAQRQDQR